jgi:hypothetical protein
MRIVCALAVIVAVGCAHQRPVTKAERSLAVGLEAVAYGKLAGGRIGQVKLVRTHAGAVHVLPLTVRAGDGLDDDAAIESDVRGRLSLDPLTAGERIEVDVDRGIVTLSGDIEERDQAARAVQVSLDAPGVKSVVTRLSWIPAQEMERLARRRGQTTTTR